MKRDAEGASRHFLRRSALREAREKHGGRSVDDSP